jgi:diamine N-acetyltransferase
VTEITLRPVTDENRAELEALRVSPSQENFVSGVADSLEEARLEPEGRGVAWGIYDGAVPVGFVMVSDGATAPGYFPNFLWKLLIDERYQRRGYGTATLDQVVRYFRARGVDVLWTSAGVGDGTPQPFYERYGFVSMGVLLFDDEMLLRLEL